MNYKKIIVYIAFLLYVLDKHYIDKENFDYNAWIIIFLFFIACNTAKKEE